MVCGSNPHRGALTTRSERGEEMQSIIWNEPGVFTMARVTTINPDVVRVLIYSMGGIDIDESPEAAAWRGYKAGYCYRYIRGMYDEDDPCMSDGESQTLEFTMHRYCPGNVFEHVCSIDTLERAFRDEPM
jgi:hypothetical protein